MLTKSAPMFLGRLCTGRAERHRVHGRKSRLYVDKPMTDDRRSVSRFSIVEDITEVIDCVDARFEAYWGDENWIDRVTLTGRLAPGNL
jgi:hypothetical protein